MPLWHIYAPKGAYAPAEKERFAVAITDLYAKAGLPKFYVSVVFQELEPNMLYIGGKSADAFVRIWIDHIARRMEPAQYDWWMHKVCKVVNAFVEPKSFAWELHIDETPMPLWTIQGLRPPAGGSEIEQKWAAKNSATPYEGGTFAKST